MGGANRPKSDLKIDPLNIRRYKQKQGNKMFKKLLALFGVSVCVISLVVVCSSETSRRASEGNSGTNYSNEDRRSSSSSSSGGSGTSYCLADKPACENEGNCCEDNGECKRGCKEYFNNNDEDECFSLPTEDGQNMIKVLEFLEDADFGEVGVREGHLQSVCLAIHQIETDSWLDLIENYSPSEAKQALEWIAENREVTSLLMEWDKSISQQILKALLVTAGGQDFDTDDIHDAPATEILKGLQASQTNLFHKAVQESNDDIIRFVHNTLVRDDICEVGTWQPRPGSGYSGYKESIDDIEPNTPNGQALRRQREACILGIYCEIFNKDTAFSNKSRREIARIVDEDDVERLIRDDKSTGGLQSIGTRTDSPGEWPHLACKSLCRLWYPVEALPLSIGSANFAKFCPH